MSAVHACPATVKVACDHAQRLKPCAIAPVTPLRACAFAATAGKASGASPGMTSCPSFHRAVSHWLAMGSFGAMPHNSSAAGHRPKRKYDARGLGRRMCSDMRADRGGGR